MPPRHASLATPLEPSTPAAPALARRVGHLLRRAAFHVLHPEVRSGCVEAPPPPALARLYYTAADGWRAPLLHLPAAPGSPGEPVVLAHALGMAPDAFRYGAGPTLARALSQAGFSVYLLAHRGDRDALPPRPGLSFDFDDVLERDVPAALARVAEHAGFPRVHWVGHGLGGQLGLAWASRGPEAGVATVAALCAPVRFEGSRVRSQARRVARAAALLPAHWRLPSRAVAWASVPWVHEAEDLGGGVVPGATAGERLRGVLSHAVEDLPTGLLGQVDRWLRTGAWTDRTGLLDYGEALVDARAPLLVVAAADDGWCPAPQALAAAERWGHADRHTLVLPAGWAHLDPLLARDAPERVHAPLIRWLQARRRHAWEAQPREAGPVA